MEGVNTPPFQHQTMTCQSYGRWVCPFFWLLIPILFRVEIHLYCHVMAHIAIHRLRRREGLHAKAHSVHNACVQRAQCVRAACTMRAYNVHNACVQRAQCVHAVCTMRTCSLHNACVQRAACTVRACSVHSAWCQAAAGHAGVSRKLNLLVCTRPLSPRKLLMTMTRLIWTVL